ncbi:hypothetical protein [Streptomyces bugieae]|uniref:Protein kinase domain-containing protein n=1 Tax=Streptomyces bugieae TaxID=3098223 RepID=A0ABU7NMD2_9ACTN|nr:hypothetical protein [Streptomyces sp. DSM 41528]
MSSRDELGRYRDETGRKWVSVRTGAGSVLYRIRRDGTREGPHNWDEVVNEHQLTRLYPPPDLLDDLI